MRNCSIVRCCESVETEFFASQIQSTHTEIVSRAKKNYRVCIPWNWIYIVQQRATAQHRSALPTVYFGVRWRWCLRQLKTCSSSSSTHIYIQYISACKKFFRITSVIYINYARVSESCIIFSAPTFPEPLLKFLSSFEPSSSYPEEERRAAESGEKFNWKLSFGIWLENSKKKTLE